MSHQFQYDNFVQSQIAVGHPNTYFSSGVGRQEDHQHHRENQNGSNARNSLKQKINELLGLCKDENDGIKTQFQQVMGAEREILDLMKEEHQEMPRFYNGVDNYVRSNVQMFNGAGNGHEYAPQYNQGHNQRNGAGYEHQGQGRNAGVSGYSRPRSPQYQQQNQYHDPYYGQANNYSDDYYQNQPERTNILKSKVQQLKQQNSRLRSLQPQHGQSQQAHMPRYEEDPEIRQLQQQVNRLKQIVHDYENQLANLNSGNTGDKASLLRQLKDQGERIRQDTLVLLRGKASSPTNNNVHTNYYQNQNNNYQEGSHYRNAPTHIQTYTHTRNPSNAPNNPDPYQNYHNSNSQGNHANFATTPEMISSVYRGVSGLSQDQQSQFRAQLAQLRMECEQLQQENAGIKKNKAHGRR